MPRWLLEVEGLWASLSSTARFEFRGEKGERVVVVPRTKCGWSGEETFICMERYAGADRCTEKEDEEGRGGG
jgi:hypothetical protein